MRKVKKPTLVRYSKTPPPGWPTEEEWVEIEKELAKGLPTLILPKDAGPVDRTKYELCKHFILYIRKMNITQRKLAEQLGVTESRVSEILHYHIERFTIDKLLTLLNKIRPEIKLEVA
jgi:predicted XRE-type DNA-binding protein